MLLVRSVGVTVYLADAATRAPTVAPAPSANPPAAHASPPAPTNPPAAAKPPTPTATPSLVPFETPMPADQTIDGAVHIVADDLPLLNKDSPSNSALLAQENSEQAALVAEFMRRGLNVLLTDYAEDSYCVSKFNGVAPIVNELHWSYIDPQTSTDTSYSYFGVTQTTLEVYWHFVDGCKKSMVQPLYIYDAAIVRSMPSPIPIADSSNSRVYFNTKAYNLQVRAPTDFLASLFGILTLLHPAGHVLVAASVTAGISSVSGAFNTMLDSAYKGHDLTQAAVRPSGLERSQCVLQ